jgi:hypothetical protein
MQVAIVTPQLLAKVFLLCTHIIGGNKLAWKVTDVVQARGN